MSASDRGPSSGTEKCSRLLTLFATFSAAAITEPAAARTPAAIWEQISAPQRYAEEAIEPSELKLLLILATPEDTVLRRLDIAEDNMDQLRQGIALRGYGQKDPVVEYRIEGFDMFDQMVDSIRESSIKMLLTIEVRQAGAAPKREQVAKPTGEGFVPGNGAPGVKGAPKGQPVRVIKVGRNDPCPCGSGFKCKKCTCAQYHPTGNNGGEE